MHKILDIMKEIVLGDNGLRHVISLDTNGEAVTAGDLIAQSQPERREASLDVEGMHAADRAPAKDVSALRDDEVDRIVEAYLNSIPKGRAIAIESYGVFTVSQLREELRNRTAVGEEIKNTVLQYNRFIEEAIRKGMIRTESSIAAG
jgi:hypothetical protein